MAGRAPWAILSVIVFSNIAFMSLSTGGVNAFEWLLALAGLCALVNWGSICLAHVMFRIAWKKSNHSLDELAYKAPLGIWGSVTALVLIILAMMAQVSLFTTVRYPYLTCPVLRRSLADCRFSKRRSIFQGLPCNTRDIDFYTSQPSLSPLATY